MAFNAPHCTLSDFEFERDSPSPYPPSTPSIDSSDDEEEQPMYLARFGLRASVAALPDHQLRGIVLRLLDTSYSFRRALQKEIAFADHEEPDTPPTTPTATTHRRGKARRATRSRKSRKHAEGTQRSLTLPHQPLRPESPAPQLDSGADHVYHPGMPIL